MGRQSVEALLPTTSYFLLYAARPRRCLFQFTCFEVIALPLLYYLFLYVESDVASEKISPLAGLYFRESLAMRRATRAAATIRLYLPAYELVSRGHIDSRIDALFRAYERRGDIINIAFPRAHPISRVTPSPPLFHSPARRIFPLPAPSCFRHHAAAPHPIGTRLYGHISSPPRHFSANSSAAAGTYAVAATPMRMGACFTLVVIGIILRVETFTRGF